MQRIEECRDGSHTVYSETYNQFYHNPNGAVAESIHVFFETSGLLDVLRSGKPVNVLEIGFGTGLNALLLADFKLVLGSTSPVLFQSVEAFPISVEVAGSLNYARYLNNPELGSHLVPICSQLQQESVQYNILPDMKIRVFRGAVEDADFGDEAYNIVFHDPFSPEVNAELWSNEMFVRLRSCCSNDAVLVTYCAATKARGAMAVGGWLVARAPGALGKREMTIAALDAEKLGSFLRLNERRLIERFSG
jgi:tRNA U34 5-methylaminomethyl-2-thiouridine-forming methyltransferase MnmC